MDAFSIVQDQIGNMNTWPTYILIHLFLDPPDKRTITNVSAFLYGNEISKRIARSCYAMCNGITSADTIFEGVTELYRLWNENPYKEHMAYFYELYTGDFIWINGLGLNQTEVVIPEIKVPQIGVDCLKDTDYELWKQLNAAIQSVLTNPTPFQIIDSSDENEINFDDCTLIYDQQTEKWRVI
jgi:hypothetical protein